MIAESGREAVEGRLMDVNSDNAQLQAEVRRQRAELDDERSRTSEALRRATFLERQLNAEGVPILNGRVSGGGGGLLGGDSMGVSPKRSSRGGGGFGDSGGVPPTPGMVHNSQQFYKNEATRVQNAAHATISSLRAVLEKKNRLIRDYQVRGCDGTVYSVGPLVWGGVWDVLGGVVGDVLLDAVLIRMCGI